MCVDPVRSAVTPLLELATVSRTESVKGELFLRPDVVRLGRAAPRLASLTALGEVRAACAAFDKAVRQVEKRRGEIVLHDGLLVLRIDDLGLRTLLRQRLGSALRELGGAYLAAPRGLAKEVEKVVREEGYRVTPLSLWNAAASGVPLEWIESVLARLSRYPVPELVRREIRELVGRYGSQAGVDTAGWPGRRRNR